MLRLAKVGFQTSVQGIALQGNDALVALAPFAGIQGHGHATGAEQLIILGQRPAPLGHAAHLEVLAALGHQQPHGTVALQLHRHPGTALQTHPHEHRGGNRLAQQVLHAVWIVMPGDHPLPGL